MRTHLISLVLAAALLMTSAACADLALQYKFAKGEKLIYLCTTEGAGSIQAMGRTEPLNMDAEFTYIMACAEVDRSGNMTLVHHVEDFVANAAWGAQAIPVSPDIPTVITVIAPSGKVLSTKVKREEAEEAGAEGVATEFGGSLTQRSHFDVGQFFGQLRGPGFPEDQVGPGSAWKDTVTLVTQSGQELVLNYVTKFLDYAKLEGRNCARLQTDYEIPLDLSLVGGDLFGLTGKQIGSQCAYFDYEAGRVLRYDGTSDTEVTMSTPQLFGMGGGNQVSATMTVRSVTSVILQERGGP